MRSPASGKLHPLVIVAIVAVVTVAVWALFSQGEKPSATAAPAVTPAASVTGVPDWVPIYPGAKVSEVETQNKPVETYSLFGFEATSNCHQVAAWYDEKLKLAGFDVQQVNSDTSGCSAMLIAEGPGNTRGLRISGSGDNRTSRFSISAVVRTLPGASSAAGSIPSWVPRYPNSAPSNIVANQQGPTLRVNFNFSTDDDAQTVIGWYERTLKEAQFTIVSSTVFDAAMATLTAQDPTGRSILTLRMEQAGGRKVVALEAREGVQ